MNYEIFYQELQPQEKSIKDNLASLQKLFKALCRQSENGDLKSLSRDLSAMAETAAAVSASLDEMDAIVKGFDTKSYF